MRVWHYIKNHPLAVLMAVILLLTMLPVAETFFVVGDKWQGFPPTFTDETFYYAHVQNIAEGYYNDGNPYFFEHRNDPPAVIFGGAWIDAIPLMLGVPFNAAMMLNFIIWSFVFAALYFKLFREFSVPPWTAAAGTVFLYLQSYSHIFRPANLQTVWPVFILFYIALARLLRRQSRADIVLLGLAAGASFYLFAYLWQIVVVTLGLLALYALAGKNWPLLKAALLSSLIGGAIGLPVPLYTLWLSHSSPYFWEVMGRFGLVHTRLPMAEIIYSGGWIGLVLALLAALYWMHKPVREDGEFLRSCVFAAITGLGLWIMQGGNVITGVLLETGEHVRTFIIPWLFFSTVVTGVYIFRNRKFISLNLKILSVVSLLVFALASSYFMYKDMKPYLHPGERSGLWAEEQTYAAPFAWLQAQEKSPVVVWSDPRQYLSPNLPIFTRHYQLFATFGMWHIMSDAELWERYLVSQYFDSPSVASLKADMDTYLGRGDTAHKAKTAEREIKVCRIVYFWDKNKDCGTVQTPAEFLGDPFFTALEKQFTTDIKPNIKKYLKKYHVSYILKDDIRNQNWHPGRLGAVVVWSDGRYTIYRLPQ